MQPPYGQYPSGQYPEQQYPQQGYAPPPQQPTPPKKKGGPPIALLAALLVLPVLGLAAWLIYQHFFNWGYLRAPDFVKAHVDPVTEELQKIAEKAAKGCNEEGTDLDNPLEGAKVLETNGLQAASIECRQGWSDPSFPFKPLDSVPELFTVNIRNHEGFKCMAPNWLGVGGNDQSDCVMWKGATTVYMVKRTKGGMSAEVRVEWGPGGEKKSTKKKKKKVVDDDDE